MGIKLIKRGLNLPFQEQYEAETEKKFKMLMKKYNLNESTAYLYVLGNRLRSIKEKGHNQKYNDFLFIRNEVEKNSLKSKKKYKITEIETEILKRLYRIIFISDLEPILFSEYQNKEPQLVGIIHYLEKDVEIDSPKKPMFNEYKKYDAFERALEKYYSLEKKQEKKIELQRVVIDKELKHTLYYIYRNNLYSLIFEDGNYSEEEKKLLIKEHYFKHEKKFQRILDEIKLFEKLEASEEYGSRQSREPIPEEVRFFVWRRDNGKCIKCGSNEKLEFDHIIPVSKGGSNTERNIQLLCEKCNRGKSDKI